MTIEQKKRSLAERLSRTLDKLALVSGRGGGTPVNTHTLSEPEHRTHIPPDHHMMPGGAGAGAHPPPPHPATAVYGLYPGYHHKLPPVGYHSGHPGYRTVRSPQGVNYHYVAYNGWEPGVFGYTPVPVPSGSPAAHKDYIYSNHPGPSPGICRCPDSGKDSVRSKSGGLGRCRRCNLDRLPVGAGGSIAARKPQLRARLPNLSSPQLEQSSRSTFDPSKQRRVSPGPKDPYDYIRRTRLKAEDWDNYWEHQNGQLQPQPSRSSSSSSRVNQTTTTAVCHTPQPHQHSIRKENDQSTSILNKSQDIINNSDNNKNGHKTKSDQKRVEKFSETENNDVVEDNHYNDITLGAVDNQAGLDTGDKVAQSSSPSSRHNSGLVIEEESGDELQDLDDSPATFVDGEEMEDSLGYSEGDFADLVNMKSRLANSETENRYRKYQRRKPLRKAMAMQLEEVIIEEREEDLVEDSYTEGIYTSIPPNQYDTVHEGVRPRTNKTTREGDDELGLGKFSIITASTNFADEIFTEIYGKLTSADTSLDSQDSEATTRSLADEILEEIYGTKVARVEEEEEGIEDKLSEQKSPKTDVRGLYRSVSLQERGATSPFSSMQLQDISGLRVSRRASLLHLSSLPPLQCTPSLPPLPGTPTLHRPRMPPPPPPAVIQTNLQPFSDLELLRINSFIQKGEEVEEMDDFYNEISDKQFETGVFDYENVPLVRPSPEGAEAESEREQPQYDIPENNKDIKTSNSNNEDKDDKENFDGVMIINRSFEEPPPKEDMLVSYDPNISIDSLSSSTGQMDISVDSLNMDKIDEILFDKDTSDVTEISNLSAKSVIHSEGDKTIILSSGLVNIGKNSVGGETCNVTISSSSWINIENGNASVSSTSTVGVSDIRHDEPVKPPRLKKLARQQSKQEHSMRSKSLITGIVPELSTNNNNTSFNNNSNNNPVYVNDMIKSKSRPEIGPPVLINSTLNQTDLESHKCIHLNSEDSSGDDSIPESPYNNTDMCSDNGSSFYTLESVLDETYRSRSVTSTSAQGADLYNEHIYEEIVDSRLKIRPLPPIPENNNNSKVSSASSIFTGATKSEILHYLNDARLRIGGNSTGNESDSAMSSSAEEHFSADGVFIGGGMRKPHRISAVSNLSDSSNSSNDSVTDSSVLWRGNSMEKITGAGGRMIDIERNDSGVGSDSGISSGSKPNVSTLGAPESGASVCRDCEAYLGGSNAVSSASSSSSNSDDEDKQLCGKCSKRRVERKEIISEIVETEIKYGNDLRIIMDEFYRPMLVAGLLTPDHLSNIFLNVEQLITVNTSFSTLLKESLEGASRTNDDDLSTVDIGSAFLDSLSMLQAFEAYCTKQAASSMLLANLEREKELLRVFLTVSQMENKVLRRMNLSSFLMVPVQRVTKYPLLLSRLYKVTPISHPDRDNLKQAQTRIEAALDQMNKDAKDILSIKGAASAWRRSGPGQLGNQLTSGGKKIPIQREMNNIRVRKLSLEMLGWGREDSRFAMEGKLVFAQITDTNWRNKWKGTVNGSTSGSGGLKLVTANALLVVTGIFSGDLKDMSSPTKLIFPIERIKEAVLLLLREKTSRFSTVRDPIYLGKTVIHTDPDTDCFEIQEFGAKESLLFKADDPAMTTTWFQTLQLYSQSLGGWRRRRRGMANIMVDPGTS